MQPVKTPANNRRVASIPQGISVIAGMRRLSTSNNAKQVRTLMATVANTKPEAPKLKGD